VKRIIIVVVLLLFSLNLYSQDLKILPVSIEGNPNAFNIGVDKLLHFTTSYTIAYTTYHFLKPRIGNKKARAYAGILSFSAGVIKEVLDERYRTGYEKGDIIANMGGVLLFKYHISLK